MRFLTYIKSHNETLIIAVIAIVIAIPVIFLSTNNEATKNLADKPEWTTSTTTSIDIHGYTIKFERKFTKDANNKDKILETGITLSKGGKNVFIKKSKGNDWESFYAIGGEYNQIDSADDIKKFAIKDLNKNGVPELVFAVFSGGFHCCSQNYIIELSDPISFLLDLDTGNQIIELKDLNHDGIMEIETSEDVFTYWNTSYGSSPMPRVVLSIQDGVYKADPALMREPAPTDAVLQKKAKVIESWSGAVGPEVAWKYAIDLIYSGNIKSAIKYIDLAWRDDEPGDFKAKDYFWQELQEQIEKSPYYTDLSSFFALDNLTDKYVKNISGLEKNILDMKGGYKIILVSNDENIRTASKDDYFCGYDVEHPVYEGKYKIISVKDGKIISSFNLDYFENSFFTDNKPHNGLNKFIEPKTGKELITIYQYASCNNEFAFFFDLDDRGIIKPVKFYTDLVMDYNPDDGQEGLSYLITSYNGLISSLYRSDNDGGPAIGVCLYGNAEVNTHCVTFEYKNGSFHSTSIKKYEGKPQL